MNYHEDLRLNDIIFHKQILPLILSKFFSGSADSGEN